MQLDTHQPIPGAQLTALSEHVSYWNDGWPDQFASARLTARQGDYIRALKLSPRYTPQFIVDDFVEVRLNDRPEVEYIVRSAAASPKILASMSSVKVADCPQTMLDLSPSFRKVATLGTSVRRCNARPVRNDALPRK